MNEQYTALTDADVTRLNFFEEARAGLVHSQ